MKDLKQLTKKECEEILEFVFPDQGYWVKDISHDVVIREDGSTQVTFGLRPIIGIHYHNGQDNCILHFDNTKCMIWLYKNGYDISEQLEMNKDLTQIENDIDNLAYSIHYMCDTFSDKFTDIDILKQRLIEAANKYYYEQ